MKKRPITTLFMLESLDGKISSGNTDELDADKDWCEIDGVKEGLHQYYEIEATTDYFSLNTGRVMAKIGVNDRKEYHNKVEIKFVIIDNKPHLNENGIDYLCNWVESLILVTTNKNHIAYSLTDKYDNLDILYYEELDLTELLEDLYSKYNAERLTIQSGGSLNGLFLRNNLIDYVNIVIAPLLVGGKDVSTLIDGEAISSSEELNKLKALELIECNQLDNSYVQLKYKVKNKSEKYKWIKNSMPLNIQVKQVYGIIFSDEGNIVLRVDNNKYKLTGGKPEDKDINYLETLKRECFEELNIEITDIYYLGYMLVEEESNYAQLRMIAKIKNIGEVRPDLDTGKKYKRFMCLQKNAKKYLNYKDTAGNMMIDDAIKLANEKYSFKLQNKEYYF